MAQGVNIESAAANGNDGFMFFEECVEQGERLVLILRNVVRLGDTSAGDEMVGSGSKFLIGRSGDTDVKLFVKLT